MTKGLPKSYIVVNPKDDQNIGEILREINRLLLEGKQVYVKVGESKYTVKGEE